ncbi:fumarylacetoacetate hydrolase family protein [Pseudonocardia broussonetiae]|uniref:Fumarylacetoacetate hydrolase family protein n=1 Tax=Pseudonocardia broussonetiae TaxID=2736640 RepID=A0A6M6J9F7_9PSEU|nr:fumarylacetoacetate hydrolase family protein [Pseudonocardia broussonetiae]QJY44474.1 fumarylacetoacetate hydrolase family protein [Pseudonocardia broussonetiae]
MTWSLVTYDTGDGGSAVGVLDSGTVRALPRYAGYSLLDLLGRWEVVADDLRATVVADLPPAGVVRLLAPVRPNKVVCAGANYFAHLAEMQVDRPDPVGPPFFFLKPPSTTVIGPGDAIVLPDRPDRRIDWEAELGVVIGRRARDLDESAVAAHVAGYTIVNDVSARDRLRRDDAVAPPFGFDWTSAKGEDTFCPTGPGVTPAWFVDDPQDLRITLSVNGAVKQDSSTADMMNSAFAVVAAASRIMTLEPGDIVATGSPAGVGAARGDFLRPGDEVVIEIAGLGVLRNPVVDGALPRDRAVAQVGGTA